MSALEIDAVAPMRDLRDWRRRMWTPRPRPFPAPRETRHAPAPLPGDLAAVARASAAVRGARRHPHLREVVRAVAAHHGMGVRVMLSRTRVPHIALPRQIAMLLAVRVGGLSLAEAGRRLGRDHTTVRHAALRIERLMASDPRLRARVEAIAAALRGDGGACGPR